MKITFVKNKINQITYNTADCNFYADCVEVNDYHEGTFTIPNGEWEYVEQDVKVSILTKELQVEEDKKEAIRKTERNMDRLSRYIALHGKCPSQSELPRQMYSISHKTTLATLAYNKLSNNEEVSPEDIAELPDWFDYEFYKEEFDAYHKWIKGLQEFN